MATPNIPEAIVKAGGAVVNKIGWTCHDGTDEPSRYAECEECAETCDEVSRAVLTAAREHLHPVVTTEAELDALPAGSVVLDSDGDKFGSILARSGVAWLMFGTSEEWDLSEIALPATVLHRGGDAL